MGVPLLKLEVFKAVHCQFCNDFMKLTDCRKCGVHEPDENCGYEPGGSISDAEPVTIREPKSRW